jgi:signal transduction histidine kinase
VEKTIRILILEDNFSDTRLIERELRKDNLDFTVLWAKDKEAFLEALATYSPDILLVDYSLPGFDGMTAMALARSRYGDIPVVLVSGAIGEERAIEALRAGATDYVLKQGLKRLGPVIRRALQEAEQAAEKKRALEELKRSNEELEQFAYVASHDLKEPLRAVVGFLQLLQNRYGDKLDEEGLRFIERSVKAGFRMQTMINDLLTLSKIHSKGSAFIPTDLNQIVKDVLEHLQLTKKNVTVTCAELPNLALDASQIHSLFQNLISNAMKYNESSIPVISIECRELDNAYQFLVKDNGIGISTRFHQRIFQVFQRLHTDRDYPGTGMGLALCKKIVERHRGKIWVESNQAEGSTFHFTLPKQR